MTCVSQSSTRRQSHGRSSRQGEGPRISVDTGGTFTDVVVDSGGRLTVGKSLSTHRRASEGVLLALGEIAAQLGTTAHQLLTSARELRYGTTIATNAIVEGTTARTAFLTTQGFPDILLLREGGKADAFSRMPFPAPYVPRHLTFEIDERITADGQIRRALDTETVERAVDAAVAAECQAIGVCLLWSVANPVHEQMVGRLIEERAPHVAFTLSHVLNPVVREYRRASSTVLDASLKPLAQAFFGELEDDLREAGLTGNFLISTSFGGAARTPDVLAAPVHVVNSGPAMAPVAAQRYAQEELSEGERVPQLLVCDTGGTTFDVSVVTDGALQYTTETWLGGRWTGHITGTRAVDVQSIGAGGGSITWVDDGGLMHVGPRSAGADPGPACYGRRGREPTVTDAALVLGYLDDANFLGGRMRLSPDAAREAFVPLMEQLSIDLDTAADATMKLATENVTNAIRQVTVGRGVDPRSLDIVAGGGASGLNIGEIARELETRRVLLPPTASALSACGALFADLVAEFTISHYLETRGDDVAAATELLAELDERADDFIGSLEAIPRENVLKDFSVEARYPRQVWELNVPIPAGRLASSEDLRRLEAAFDEAHQRTFAVMQPEEYLECLSWKVRVSIDLGTAPLAASEPDVAPDPEPYESTPTFFRDLARVMTPRYLGPSLPSNTEVSGPAIISEPTTTLVIPPGMSARITRSRSYVMRVAGRDRDDGPRHAARVPSGAITS